MNFEFQRDFLAECYNYRDVTDTELFIPICYLSAPKDVRCDSLGTMVFHYLGMLQNGDGQNIGETAALFLPGGTGEEKIWQRSLGHSLCHK